MPFKCSLIVRWLYRTHAGKKSQMRKIHWKGHAHCLVFRVCLERQCVCHMVASTNASPMYITSVSPNAIRQGGWRYLVLRSCWLRWSRCALTILNDTYYCLHHSFWLSRSSISTLSYTRLAGVLLSDFQILEQCNGRVDIMHYHVGTSSTLGHTWTAVAEQYKSIMRDPNNINFVTIFREPRAHFLSYYYYFVSHKIGHVRAPGYLTVVWRDRK